MTGVLLSRARVAVWRIMAASESKPPRAKLCPAGRRLHEGAVALDADALEDAREDPTEDRTGAERGDELQLALVDDRDAAVSVVLAVVDELMLPELGLVGPLDRRLEDLVDRLAGILRVDVHLRQEPREANAPPAVLDREEIRHLRVGRDLLLERAAAVLHLRRGQRFHPLREVERAALDERGEIELASRLLPEVIGG